MSYLATSIPISTANNASAQSWKFFENCDYYLLDVAISEQLRAQGLLDADNRVHGKPTLLVRDYYVAYYRNFAEPSINDNIIIKNWINQTIPKDEQVVFVNHYVLSYMYTWYIRQDDLHATSKSLMKEMTPQIRP